MSYEQSFQIMSLDMKGGATEIDLAESECTADSGTGLCWIHLDYSQSAAHEWLHTISWLDPIIRTNLVDDDTRPRSFTLADGLFLSLRGVNLNPGADPEDMIAVRMWANKHCIITSNRRRLLSLEDIRTSLDRGAGPRSAASFVTLLIERITLRAETVVEQIENDFEEVEERLSIGDDAESRALLAQMRRQAIRLRRFFSPQRTALEHLLNDSPGWFVKRDKLHIRESIDKFNRYVEELDSLRDRAIVAQEEFISRLSETLNKRMYTLSLVATLFLPLGFLTGLLGINVGGIPGAESPYGFAVICIGIITVCAGMIALLKIKKWF
ncbi:MAG: zinc transporter ZntB [Desulfofustis sp.]